MSGSLNKVMLIGHLGDDVKIHHFEGGGQLVVSLWQQMNRIQKRIQAKKLRKRNGTT